MEKIMDMDTARFSFCRILVALSMVCFAANLYSGEPLRQRTFAMDGYRPVTLPEYKIVAENPFPLSKGEKNSLLDSVSRVCRTCLGKYPDRNLDTWPKEDCEAYLRAKAVQLILQFQPDYYRTYARPEIHRYTAGTKGEPYYLLAYYYDRTKESNGSPLSLKFKMPLVHVAIFAENAEGFYLAMPIIGDFYGGSMSTGNIVPIYLQEKSGEKWVPYPYIIRNKDFDWGSKVLFE